MEVGFRHGAMCDSYEKQANEQGFTLGEKAELFEKIGFSYNLLRIHGYLTDSQADMVCKKIQKNLVKNIKPIKESDSERKAILVAIRKINNGKNEAIDALSDIDNRYTRKGRRYHNE